VKERKSNSCVAKYFLEKVKSQVTSSTQQQPCYIACKVHQHFEIASFTTIAKRIHKCGRRKRPATYIVSLERQEYESSQEQKSSGAERYDEWSV
jgi:hypothetical protein